MSKSLFNKSSQLTVDDRSILNGHEPLCIWFSGLSGAGKTTLSIAIEKKLSQQGKHTFLLDGDKLRSGICSDLGFSNLDRKENIRRVAEIAKMMMDAGLIVIVSLITPFEADRKFVKNLIGSKFFKLVYLSTSLDICESRDVKGLYQKARSGEIKNFTGIDSSYEIPLYPNIVIDTNQKQIDQCADLIIRKLF